MKKINKILCTAICTFAVLFAAGCSNASSGNGGSNDNTPGVYKFHETVEVLPAGTDGTAGTDAKYVYFGDYPQDLVADADVETLGLESSTTKLTRGQFEYVLGTDNNYYYYGKTHQYWFKVMPIKWRVVTDSFDYDGTNTAKLLVAENVLDTCSYYSFDSKGDVREIKEGENTVYVKNNNYKYSRIRAFLNGLEYYYYDGQNLGKQTEYYKNGNALGFLQTAFTETATSLIKETVVKNNADSTTDSTNKNFCDDTTDKIFLISRAEARYTVHSSTSKTGTSDLKREPTKYAVDKNAHKATGSYGSYWWLRSPSADYVDCAGYINIDGSYSADTDTDKYFYGVVPALAISF